MSIFSASFSSKSTTDGVAGTFAFDCEWNNESTADASNDLMILFEILFMFVLSILFLILLQKYSNFSNQCRRFFVFAFLMLNLYFCGLILKIE